MTPIVLVQAFDECRDYVFGRSLGRDNPHKSDIETAQSWIDKGVTLTVAIIVFHEQMSWMHEKFLRFGQGTDKSLLPSTLKLFDDNIDAAIRRHRSGGQDEHWEFEMSRWRARCKGWMRGLSWREELWGPSPIEKATRVPRAILEEIKPKDRKSILVPLQVELDRRRAARAN